MNWNAINWTPVRSLRRSVQRNWTGIFSLVQFCRFIRSLDATELNWDFSSAQFNLSFCTRLYVYVATAVGRTLLPLPKSSTSTDRYKNHPKSSLQSLRTSSVDRQLWATRWCVASDRAMHAIVHQWLMCDRLWSIPCHQHHNHHHHHHHCHCCCCCCCCLWWWWWWWWPRDDR